MKASDAEIESERKKWDQKYETLYLSYINISFYVKSKYGRR